MNNIKISVCMALYSRPNNLPLIRKALNRQTFQDYEFLVWDNTKKNEGSQARFWLVQEAKGKAIVFIDDDEIPQPAFLEYMYQKYLNYPRHLLGWFTRIFNNEEYKKAIVFSKSGTLVDYVGTGGMVVDKQLFTTSPELYHIPKECALAEDLYLSYVARRAGYKLMAVEKHLDMKHDGKNQCRNLWPYKEEAFKYLRQEGWKLLKDQTKN